MLRYAPLRLNSAIRHIRRTFTGPGSAMSVADRVEVLHPEEEAELPEPIVLDGQLERILGTSVHTTIAAEIEQATRRSVVHDATLAFQIKNATIIDGSIYAGNMRHYIGSMKSSSTPQSVDRGALVSSTLGYRYFGHWLRDDCSRYLLANGMRPIISVTPPHSEAMKFADIFNQDWRSPPLDAATVEDLLIYQDHSQNSFKRERYNVLRGQLLERYGSPKATSLIYLRRGNSGASRPIANEEELLRHLPGFSVVDMTTTPFDERVRALLSASVVVSMEGSHCTHCAMTLAPKSSLIILQPPVQFSAVHRGWANCLSINFGFVVGEQLANGTSFNPSEVARTVDRALKSRAFQL